MNTYGSTNKLNVANLEQKIIFCCEMVGQISDGWWENTRPMDHWRPICQIGNWNNVDIDPLNTGFTFRFIGKNNYNFADPELLKIVGPRMIFKIKSALMYPEVVLPILESGNHWLIPSSLKCLEGILNSNDPYYVSEASKLRNYGLTTGMLMNVANNEDLYTMKDLRRDCRELMKIIRTSRI